MMSTHLQTNGASLEDCHTNFFALTDLCGIKWRVYVWDNPGGNGVGGGDVGGGGLGDPLEDPVLVSYARMMAADVLCVWRRTWRGPPPHDTTSNHHHPHHPHPHHPHGPHSQPPPYGTHPSHHPPHHPHQFHNPPHHPQSQHQQRHSLRNSPKELWVFWYGEDPDLTNLLAPELLKSEEIRGSWDWETGLSYECRTLLFKALHNLIERCLISRDFVRLGRWFVQPYDGPEGITSSRSTHLSFSLSFFVHGESRVCASVDVRQHPAVRQLNKKHLLLAQQTNHGIPVILGPYGLSGTLTGVSYNHSDPTTQKLLQEWKMFFPLESKTEEEPRPPEKSLPAAVEVIVGGYKMRYPTNYVLVTDMDDYLMQSVGGGSLINPQPNTVAPSGLKGGLTNESIVGSEGIGAGIGRKQEPTVNSPFTASTHTLLDPGYLNNGGRGLGWSHGMSERVWQDIVQCPGQQTAAQHDGLMPEGGALTPAEIAGQWDFSDPASKINCTCAKLGGVGTPGGGNGPGAFGGYKGGGVTTPGSVPSLRCTGVADGPPPSVDSPASVTPSPLPTPHSQQPPSVPPLPDSSMPTLSPHPPPSNASMCDPSTPNAIDSVDVKPNVADLMGPKSESSMNQGMSPYPEDGDNEESNENNGTHGEGTGNTNDGGNSNAGNVMRGLKRPILPSTDYNSFLELEKPSTVLYDYTRLHAWLHHPVKKFKPSEPKLEEPLWPPYRPAHIQEHMELLHSRSEVNNPEIPEMNGLPIKRSGIKRPADPYEFEDDCSTAAPDTFKKEVIIKEEPRTPPSSVRSSHDSHSPSQPKKTGNLYTSEGLEPSYADLEDIFDSDSPADEVAFPDHTPPGSNKPVGGPEDTAAVVNNKSCNSNKSSVNTSLVELTKMFPTPPSHEQHNPDHDTALEETTTPQIISIKQERLDELPPLQQQQQQQPSVEATIIGLTIKEESKECLAVFRPPTCAMFVGSAKYAPLTNLPSQEYKNIVSLPPEWEYKPTWYPSITDKSHVAVAPASAAVQGGMGPHHMGPSNLHMGPVASGGGGGGIAHSQKVGMSPISPMTSSIGGPVSDGGPGSVRGPGSVGGPASAGPPMNYDLTSPASNQSSYLNKALPSVEPPSIGGLSQVPEANSLFVNIALQDSSVNLFRDHNFDSCTMCVCNNSAKNVGNIRGSDGTLYLPPTHLSLEEESIKCNCGFSAIVNRRLAFQAGLFYEDEVDLTGLHEALLMANERKKQSLHLLLDNNKNLADNTPSERETSILDVPQSMFQLLQSQCLVTLSTPSSVIFRSSSVYQNTRRDIHLNLVDYKDGNEIAYIAVDQSRGSGGGNSSISDSENSAPPPHPPMRQQYMHKWCYYQFEGPTCSKDIVRCMKALQPHLQDAIQMKGNKKVNWEPVFSVDGPLTWRQFHRMAVRGTEDMAEPLPVPMLLTGHDKDWLTIAPQSLKYWEKLLLEPYSQQRNVAYVVMAPDNEFILNHVRTFFKELSSIYELCKLGRHAPIQRVLRNGIMRISKTAASKVANEPLEEWFSLLGDSHMSTKLKVYAQVCRHWLAPHLATFSMDKSLFEAPGSARGGTERQAPSPMPPPSSESNNTSSNPSSTPTHNSDPSDYCGATTTNSQSTPVMGTGASLNEVEDDDSPPPAILIYLVDPFSVGQEHPDMHRLVTLGLLRCYEHMLEGLTDNMQQNVYLQILSLESILELTNDSHDRSKHIDQLKSLAFSVFMQCRRTLTHHPVVKSLAGFGPTSVYDEFLKTKDPAAEEKRLAPYPIFSPAYILAPIKESRGTYKEAQEALGVPREKSTILNCTYCLSEDQRWLLATATDELGEILETVTISIEIPNRTRRKKASARRYALKKLMDWILSVMSIGVHPWRLVVGRLGRMGHGELKGWSSLLSKKSLIQASKNLKEMCKQCAYLFPDDAPCILSACLVSMEPDSTFRMMPDMFTPDERFGQNSQNCSLSTPQDLTCTHILVFPTSATAQSAQQRFQDEQDDEQGFPHCEDLLLEEGGLEGDIDSSIGIGMGLNISDILGLDGPNQDDQLEDGNCQQNSLSQPGSPTMGGTGRISPSQFSGQARSNGVVLVDPEEDAGGSVLQQPLALGYYVSTASTGKLPRWFWSSCPHLESACPVFLKSALHLHSPGVTQPEDFFHTQSKVHPLDSSFTTDVLRYVLEGYNGLSWLVMDPAKQDRRSCLPLHMQVLSHLYNVMAALV